MAIDSCVTRIANSIKKSSITAVEKQELISQIKSAVAQAKKAKLKAKLDKIDIDKISTDITEQIKTDGNTRAAKKGKFYGFSTHFCLLDHI